MALVTAEGTSYGNAAGGGVRARTTVPQDPSGENSRWGTAYGTTTPGSSSRFQASPANGQLIAPVTPRRRIGDLNRQTDHRGQTSNGTADGVTPADRHADIVGSKSGDLIVRTRQAST